MHQDTAKRLFKKCHRLFRQGYSKSEISRKLHITRDTIIDWLSKDQWIENRGWPKGRPRIHTDLEEQRILEIRNRIVNQERRYYWGKDVIQREYKKLYPQDPVPSEWFISEVIRNHHLQIPEPQKRKKDLVRYLHYPYNLIKNLGKVKESIDFIGRKYIDNHSDPLHFLGRYYLKPIGLYLVSRTENEKNQAIIKVLKEDWLKFPPPKVALLDNANAMYGPAKAKHFIGLFVQELFQHQITPVFVPPKSPWAQAGIEGSNSIFGKKFWQRHRFQSIQEVDKELKRFNQENIGRANLNHLFQSRKRKQFKQEVYFVRFAKIDSEQNRFPSIEVLNDKIYLPETYAYQYTFAKINIDKEQLIVYVERQAKSQIIHQQKFSLRFTKSKIISLPNLVSNPVIKKVKTLI